MVDSLSTNFETKVYKKYRELSQVWEAILLDPRFKQHGFFKDENKLRNIKSKIIDKCCKVKDNKNQSHADQPRSS